MNQTLGILGGTFDPIHFGHLRMAEELMDRLNLDKVCFIPAGHPPHRTTPQTAALHRLEMVQLAVADNPRFCVDDRETRLERASYTVDTLTDLRSELGYAQPIWLLLGADAFLGLPSWKNWRQLFELANIAVAHRPGYELVHADSLNAELREEVEKRLMSEGGRGKGEGLETSRLCSPTSGSILLVPITPLGISATDIRHRLQSGRSARYLLPDSVLDYIQEHQLYFPV